MIINFYQAIETGVIAQIVSNDAYFSIDSNVNPFWIKFNAFGYNTVHRNYINSDTWTYFKLNKSIELKSIYELRLFQ